MAQNRKSTRDPFKTPDPYAVQQEQAEDTREQLGARMDVLLAEKEDVILNLTIQKQKLKDIIHEMEKQTGEHVNEIAGLKKEVERWQGAEVDQQELERLRRDHAYLQERCG